MKKMCSQLDVTWSGFASVIIPNTKSCQHQKVSLILLTCTVSEWYGV